MSHDIKVEMHINAMGTAAPWPAITNVTELVAALAQRGTEAVSSNMILIGRTGEAVSLMRPDAFPHDALQLRLELLTNLQQAAYDDGQMTIQGHRTCFTFRARDITHVDVTLVV